MASPKQVHWIAKCLQERNVPPDLCERANAVLANAKNAHVGTLLTELFGCPRKEEARPWHILRAEYPHIEEGRYAVPSLTGHNDLDFFWVQYGDSVAPKYAGRLFVKRVTGGQSPQRVEAGHARALLSAVTDVAHARKLFGIKIGKCTECGRPLTDEASRAIGWGPDCAEANGIDHPGYSRKKNGTPLASA